MDTTPEKKPLFLRLAIDNTVKAKNFTQNVEKIESQIVHVIENQVNHYKGKDKPKPDGTSRLLPENGGLTDGHRATLVKLINRYVLLLETLMPTVSKNGRYAHVNREATKAAISSGVDGCNSILTMLDIDFERVERLLKGRIAGAYQDPRVNEQRNKKLDYLHRRCEELGISDKYRKRYQRAKYGIESSGDFSVAQLFDYCEYLSQPSPSLDPYEGLPESERPAPKEKPQKPKLNTQQRREAILEQWLIEREKLDPTFDRWLMTYSTGDFYRILREKLGRMFMYSDDTLRHFMETQKICTLKVGRDRTNNE